MQTQTLIPTRLVGPIKIISTYFTQEVRAPLATLETPLWFSVDRGARVSRRTDGIKVVLVSESMSRSILLEAKDAEDAVIMVNDLAAHRAEMDKIVYSQSRFTKLQDWNAQIVGNLIYLRFSFTTGGAAGHNMVTKAADLLQSWVVKKYANFKYLSISGNYCVDKKNSAVNGILGRGKYMIAELTVPRKVCIDLLHVMPEQLVEINIKKNLIGSIISGGIRTANAHFANMLLAFYLATGQDAANIVEGSQGFTHAEMRGDDLYFSVTLPNVIVGAVGSHKNLPYIQNNISALELFKDNDHEFNARALAIVAASLVWCGELSLLAAQVNPGELMRSHVALERKMVKN